MILPGTDLPDHTCSLRYSRKARKLRISVQPGKVTVTLPQGADPSLAEAFIEERQLWIKGKLVMFENARGPSSSFSVKDGTDLWVMGKRIKLRIISGSVEPRLIGEELLAGENALSTGCVQNWLDGVLLQEAHRVSRRVSDVSGLHPSLIRLGNAATRWGSCSAKGVVMVNRKLVHAPLNIIEYIVTHEVMHIKHRNHSRKFWSDLSGLVPDVSGSKRWLRLQGAHLI